MSRFNKIFRSSTSRSLPARKARLGIEALEARDVPSASLINEILTVRGTTGNDKIELISPQANHTIVRVNGVEQFNGFDTITKIKVDGRAGTDTVLIRGIQSGVVDGVDIKNSEIVAIGQSAGRSAGARGQFSTDAIRSNIFIDQAQFISINNTASNVNQNVVVSATAVTGASPVRIGFNFANTTDSLVVQTGSGVDTITMNSSQVGSTQINAGAGADAININGSTGSVTVNGQSGADSINITPLGRSLSAIGGNVTVKDTLSQDTLDIHDDEAGASAATLNSYNASLSANPASLSANRFSRTESETFRRGFFRFTRTDSAAIDFGNLAAVNFHASTRAATASRIDVRSSNAATTTTIDAGATNVVNIGDVSGHLDPVDGPVNVVGGSATSILRLNDSGETRGQRYTVGADTVSRFAVGTIDMANFAGKLQVRGSRGADTFNVLAPRTGGRAEEMFGNGGSDLLIAPNGDNDFKILSQNTGLLNDSISYFGMENLDGKSGTDTFHFANGASVDGRIDGGGGFDTLDYKDYTTGVSVNLNLGTATGVGGGVNRIANVFGGSAGDILVGNAASNVLLGNGGAAATSSSAEPEPIRCDRSAAATRSTSAAIWPRPTGTMSPR